jgi:hypothetical protein
MTYMPAQLETFVDELSRVIKRCDIQRSDWKRQTDAVKVSCVAAQMVAEDPNQVFLVDGRIEASIISQALRGGNVKGFFNQRCHDKRLKCRRIIVFDTKSGGGMDRVANSASDLHFHAVFLLEKGQDKTWLIEKLCAVFGKAHLAGRQFKIKQPDPKSHYTFAGRQGSGIAGKICYMMSHAGTTHAVLGLNEDAKRSRKAPKTRGACNQQSKGLAAGRPSNFLSSITICDNVSKREAKRAFDDWVALSEGEDQSSAVEARTAAVTSHEGCNPSEPLELPYIATQRRWGGYRELSSGSHTNRQ